MLVTLDVFRGVIGVACKAYRRFVPARTPEVSRLEWCCGCVTSTQHVRGTVVWTSETCCGEHRRTPLRTVHPPLGGSNGFLV